MRALPVDAAAPGADGELVVVLPGPRQKGGVDGRLRDVAERLVAAKTAGVWLYRQRAEPLQHFHELPVRFGVPDEVTVGDRAALQESVVPRQDYPSFPRRQIRQCSVVGVGAIGRIEPHEAQASRQLAQVHVGHEADDVLRPRPDAGERPDIEAHETREGGDAVLMLYRVLEPYGCPVDEKQVDLGMGYAEPLEQILDGGMPVDSVRGRHVTPPRREEVVERAVHANGDLEHPFPLSPSP
jgi:hypothetical protein